MTTGVLYLALNHQCSFISADRIMLWNQDGRIFVMGWPTTIRTYNESLIECLGNRMNHGSCVCYKEEEFGKLFFALKSSSNAMESPAGKPVSCLR